MMTRGPWTKPLAFSGNTDHVTIIHYFVDFTNVVNKDEYTRVRVGLQLRLGP